MDLLRNKGAANAIAAPIKMTSLITSYQLQDKI
jgi:hypothetical protein